MSIERQQMEMPGGIEEAVEHDLVRAKPLEQINDEASELYQRLTVLNEGMSDFVEKHADNKEALAITLRAHQDMMRAMKLSEELLSGAIIALGVPFGGEQIEGAGFVEVHRTGAKKRTDNERISSLVKKRLMVDCAVDEDTGEVDERSSKAVAKTVDTMVALTGAHTASFNGWRKRVAKSLDIDVNDYETSEGGRLVVTIL